MIRHDTESGIDRLLVSIVIPHFDRSELLGETIDSIRAQTYERWEVIVVDDGSTAEHWAAVSSLADDRIRVERRADGPKGPSRCRNLGAKCASGEYLVFVDSDDLLAPWCLEQRVREAARAPEESLWVFPVMLFERQPGDMEVLWNRLEGDDDLERFLRSDPPWHTSSPLWRREAFLSLGGFNEAVVYGDDSELHTRMLLEAVPHRKCSPRLPDVFVRRGSEKRITNLGIRVLAESRRRRLVEGSKLLEETGPAHRQLWEAQYFVEGEALLFDQECGRGEIRAVMEAWVEEHRPARLVRIAVSLYFAFGLLVRSRMSLALRVARRLAMIVLPRTFFPRGGHFHCCRLEESRLLAIRHELDRSRHRLADRPRRSRI